MSQPRVSVAINNYNYASYLRECIDSALNQTYRPAEVLVVDDGSNDNSRTVIESFGSRISAQFKRNAGQASALNAGFAMSSGEIVIFLDSDDALLPDVIERIVRVWNSKISKVQFPLILVDEFGVEIGGAVPSTMHTGDVRSVIRRFGSYAGPPSSGNAYARDALLQLFPMPEKDWHISADTYPILLVPFFGEVEALRAPGGRYRIHNKGIKSKFVMNNAPATPSAAWARVQQTRDLILEELRRRDFCSARFPMLPPTISRVRLISRKVDGRDSPAAATPILTILGDAVRGIWTWPGYSLIARVAYTLWFVSIATLPLRLAEPLIILAINPRHQPRWLRYLFRIAPQRKGA